MIEQSNAKLKVASDKVLPELMAVVVKRVYEPASRADGARVLVDRLWPRGLAKATRRGRRVAARPGAFRRTAPLVSCPARSWQDFRKKYLKELAQPEAEDALLQLYKLAHKRKRLTLLFASKNETHNNAVVLKELLDGMRKPPTGTGPGAVTACASASAAVRRR